MLAEKDMELRNLLIAKCTKDILFFVNVFGWTYDPRLNDPHLPFVTYEYQDQFLVDIVNSIEYEKDTCLEKSRDMGFSWMMVVIMAWGFLNGFSSLYGSYKEDYVDDQGNMDSHFERLRYFFERLPWWLKPDDLNMKYMSISSKEHKCEISGDSGDNFGTGGRRKFVVMDEFALWRNDQKAFRKTKDISNCRIIGGTPEGKWNLYGKIMTNHPDFRDLDIKKITLHWSLHPKKTQDWYEKEKTKRTKLDVAKELDISYDDSVTGQVYKEFTTLASFGKYQFNPKWPLFTAWDFGRDMTAIIWVQRDPDTGKHYIIDAYQKPDCEITYFVPFVSDHDNPQIVYDDEEMSKIKLHREWGNRYNGHYGDPYNSDSKSILINSTVKNELAKSDIHIQTYRGSKLDDRIRKTHLYMRKLYVNEDLTDFIQAIIHSRYPDFKENAQNTKEQIRPIHDQNSHFRTTLEYYCDNDTEICQNKLPISYVQKSKKEDNIGESDFEEMFNLKPDNNYARYAKSLL